MPVLTRRSRPAAAVLAGVLLGAGLLTANLAHAEDTVADNIALGGNFEIDTDANLVHQTGASTQDWADIPQTAATPGGPVEIRRKDTDSGSSDESFGQGTKEDSPTPTKVTGGIPPNKSDLKYFGIYQEGTSSSGFLNLYWSRVQDPSGTTNMDFEFNKNRCVTGGSGCSPNGITPSRSQDDLLITYDLSNGGTKPSLSLRRWTGTATSGSWSAPDLLTSSAEATGSINTTPISDADSDGLGAHSARTFGEAQIKLDEVLPAGVCTTFGSAYLKSRSSDSFTAAVKDFVPPASVNITNCGSIEITKRLSSVTGTLMDGVTFNLFKDLSPFGGSKGAEDTAAGSCVTGADSTGVCSVSNLQFGSYWLVETVPQGYEPVADQLVTISGAAAQAHVTVVNQVATRDMTISTAQRFVPNDTATIEVADDQGAIDGVVRFRLFDNATCHNPDAGTALYDGSFDTATLPAVGTMTHDTITHKFRWVVSSANTAAYSTDKDLFWTVSFASRNTHHNSIEATCPVEASKIRIDNDTTAPPAMAP